MDAMWKRRSCVLRLGRGGRLAWTLEVSAVVLATVLFCTPARAQGQPRTAPEASEAPDLASDIIDPTAELFQLNLFYEWIGDHHDARAAGYLDDDAHAVIFRPVFPIRLWGQVNVLRVSTSYDLDTVMNTSGLDGTEAFDLLVFEQAWGRWAVGPVVRFAPRPDPAAGETEEEEDSFQVGPALAAVVLAGSWTFGAFNQNFFAEETQRSQLQPIIGYGISPWLSVSNGDMQIVWDYGQGSLSSLPLSVQANLVHPLFGQAIRWSVNPQYNLIRDQGLRSWSVVFGSTLLASPN